MSEQISAIVLAGGRGSRFGNRDKGLIEWRGKPLIAHVLSRLQRQVDDIVINCNRHQAQYRQFGFPVCNDAGSTHGHPVFEGPLAGMLAGISLCRHPLILVVPCDAPLLPSSLATRLLRTLTEQQADVCYAHDGQRAQPLFCLLRAEIKHSLEQCLADNEHSVKGWLGRINARSVDFSDCASDFANINSQLELDGLNP